MCLSQTFSHCKGLRGPISRTTSHTYQVSGVGWAGVGLLTPVAEVVRVHEGDGHGVLGMHGALVGVAPVHGIDHVGHLLPRAADGVFALLGKFPAGLDNEL